MMISIVIPTGNQPALLQGAAASALAACPGNGEVIVVDDQSGRAVKALRDVDDHPRLRIVTNTADNSSAAARNTGVAQALGEIVIFLDADDAMAADYPKRVLAAAQSSTAVWGFSHRAAQAPDGIATGLTGQDVPLLDRLPDFRDGFWIRRAVFRQTGPIRTDLAADTDVDYALRLYGRGHQAWFDATAACYSQQPDAAGPVDTIAPVTVSRCHLQTFQRHQSLFGPRSPERWALICRCLAFAADHAIEDVPKALLANLAPLDWRIRAWVFWQRRKRGNKTRQTVIGA